MSLYWMGYPIGGFFGTWLGAMLGPVYGWRVVFYVAGAAGSAGSAGVRLHGEKIEPKKRGCRHDKMKKVPLKATVS